VRILVKSHVRFQLMSGTGPDPASTNQIEHNIQEDEYVSIRTKQSAKRSVVAVIATAVIASLLALTASPAGAGALVTEKRTSGVDRYATSAATATLAYPSGTNNVVLVSGSNFADGLSAAALAGTVGGPVLLTAPGDMMGSTGNAIGTLDAGVAGKMNVYIVGGTNAVSAAQETYLKSLLYNVTRVSGADRYATAAAVADTVATKTTFGTNPYNSRKSAILATGLDFADGLAAGQIAAGLKMPILLTDGNTLSAETKAVLDSATYGIQRVYIIGGTNAVSAAVATEVAAITNTVAIEVKRISGANRYATAVEVAKTFTKATALDGLNRTSVDEVVLASGENFADALSASTYAGSATDRVLVLSAGSALSSETSTYLSGISASAVDKLRVIGGTSAIAAATMTSADTAITYSRPTATITAVEGSTKVVITFSEKMAGGGTMHTIGTDDGTGDDCTSDVGDVAPVNGTDIAAAANFKLNNVVRTNQATAAANTDNGCDTLAGTEILTAINTAKTKLTVTLPAALAVGDVFTLVGGANVATATGARQVSSVSVTVANDTSKPTVTGKMAQGSQIGVITFSETVKDFAAADVTCTDSDSTQAAGSVAQIASSTSWVVTCQAAEDITAATDYISVNSAAFTDLGANAMAANKIIYAEVDASGPGVSSAAIASTVHAQCTVAMENGAGDISHTAIKGKPAQGGLGNAWSFELIDGTSATPAVSVYDTVGRKFVITADLNASSGVQATASSIVSMLNADANYSSMFVATVGTAGNTTTADNTAPCAGGTTTYTVTVTFSEAMDNTLAINPAKYSCDANGDGVIAAAEAITEAYVAAGSNSATGVINISCESNSAAEVMTSGVSKIHVAADVADVHGNANSAAIKANIG